MLLNRLRQAVPRSIPPVSYTDSIRRFALKCDAPGTEPDKKSPGPKTGAAAGFAIHPGYLKLKDTQQKYQQCDCKPIWLKRPFDRFLFGITWGLMFIAVSMQMKMIYDMAKRN